MCLVGVSIEVSIFTLLLPEGRSAYPVYCRQYPWWWQPTHVPQVWWTKMSSGGTWCFLAGKSPHWEPQSRWPAFLTKDELQSHAGISSICAVEFYLSWETHGCWLAVEAESWGYWLWACFQTIDALLSPSWVLLISSSFLLTLRLSHPMPFNKSFFCFS